MQQFGLNVTQEKRLVIHFTTYILHNKTDQIQIKQNTLKSIPSIKENNIKINSFKWHKQH
jgi:hypothetical protein